MKNKDLAQKVKMLRNRKGYSQEELSEKAGLSLRTIQRIENGETEPHGYSLKRLAAVFEVSPDEIVDWTIQEDKGFLMSLNLSAISFIIFPFFGILIPLIIWISKKDKIKNLNDLAKDLLNFQITWSIILFIGYIFLTVRLAFTMRDGYIDASRITSMTASILLLCGIMYLFNIVSIIVNSIRISKGKTVIYFPKIRFLRK